MDLQNLQAHIRTLATLPETEAPVISCYLNLESGPADAWHYLAARRRLLRHVLVGETATFCEEAWRPIETFLQADLGPETRGVALFARAGREPFFLPLQFQAPLPEWIAVDSTPNIYHLIELKDTYHRYVILLTTEASARILEVNLGAVTAEVWRQRPALRERVGREWSREHYQNHRREREQRFIAEKVKLLERLMAAGGHTHLILAGHPQRTARVRAALPARLAARLVDVIPAAERDAVADVISATLAAFIEQEERESQAVVERLVRELRANGLAVAGPEASLVALWQGQADELVLARDFADVRVREELVRLAAQHRCHVEVVEQSDVLQAMGGAGCLLRYRAPSPAIRVVADVSDAPHATADAR